MIKGLDGSEMQVRQGIMILDMARKGGVKKKKKERGRDDALRWERVGLLLLLQQHGLALQHTGAQHIRDQRVVAEHLGHVRLQMRNSQRLLPQDCGNIAVRPLVLVLVLLWLCVSVCAFKTKKKKKKGRKKKKRKRKRKKKNKKKKRRE
mgnify:CR=1 FL=1